MSGLLFVLAVETLSACIRSCKEIKGIQVGNSEIKLSHYADDTTTLCKDELSLGKLLDLLDIYGDCSGLNLNTAKTGALWLGKNAARKDTPFGIKWPETPICALGTSFSYNDKLCEWENFTPKINKIKTLFNVWSQRDLSVYGRITIAKTLGLSKLLFSSACICTPAHVIDKVNRLIVNFVWRRKKPKIKSDTLIGSKDQGGLDMPEYETFSTSLQCAWVRRMQEGVGNQWMTIPSFYLGKVGGPFLFDCNYDINLLNLNTVPAFYIDILKCWADAQGARERDDD